MMLERNRVLRVTCGLVIAGICMTMFVSMSIAAEKNIVLFVADDCGTDLGAYGNRVVQTPNLDSLAKDGTVFTHAFCTTASCSASRSVILTGLHNHANGQYGHQHAYHKFNSYANVVSLPVYLSRSGYRTARCGKFHVAPDSVYKFETMIPGPERNGVAMAENCRKLIEEKSDKPFFLYFCTADPHRGGGAARELAEEPDRFGNPAPNSKGYEGVTERPFEPKQTIVPGFLPDTPACRAELAQYYQSISRVDQGVGRLVDVLKHSGHWDNTLFVFISDHGIAMPGAKTTLYDGGMRSPCILRNPYASRRGITCEAMVSWVDLVPTLLEFAGAYDAKSGKVAAKAIPPAKPAEKDEEPQDTRDTLPGQLHGRSFLGIIDQAKPDGWDEVFGSHTFHEIQMYYPMRVVRTRQYKLIWNIAHPLPFPFASDLWAAATWQSQFRKGLDAPYGARTVGAYIHRPKFELYDLNADPFEGRNLADEPRYAKLRDELIEKLKAFQLKTNDPWILKWEYE